MGAQVNIGPRGGGPTLKKMKAYVRLKPSQDGTKRLAERYGTDLLCVR